MVEMSNSMRGYRHNQSSSQVIREKMQILKFQQNILIGIFGGLLGSLAGTGLWVFVAYLAQSRVIWMAIPCSILVGFGMRLLGRGLDKGFGIAGALIMVLTLLVESSLASLVMPAHPIAVGIFDSIFRMGKAVTLDQLIAALPLFNILYIAIAMVISYNTSFRHISREQLLRESKLRSVIQQ